MQLLFVDDEIDIQILMKRYFASKVRDKGWKLFFATNVIEAKELLARHYFTLVVSDICMPGENGMDLAAFIRANYPDIVVFMLSAYNDEHTKKKAALLGVKSFFGKPVNLRQLMTAIEEGQMI
jgi:DNA-binding NtrC family response regulator